MRSFLSAGWGPVNPAAARPLRPHCPRRLVARPSRTRPGSLRPSLTVAARRAAGQTESRYCLEARAVVDPHRGRRLHIARSNSETTGAPDCCWQAIAVVLEGGSKLLGSLRLAAARAARPAGGRWSRTAACCSRCRPPRGSGGGRALRPDREPVSGHVSSRRLSRPALAGSSPGSWCRQAAGCG